MHVLRALRRHADVVFALALAIAFEIEIWTASYAERRPLLAFASLLLAIPFSVRVRYPLASFVAIWAGMGLTGLAAPHFGDRSLFLIVSFVFSLYSLGANARGRQAWAGAALIPACVAVFVASDGDPFHPGDVAFGAFFVGGPWLAGLALRLRRQSEGRLTARTVELEREREEKARAAVAEERARIARELHDVVAHAISVIVLQARGGRRLLAAEPESARDAFDTIESTGQEALDEMRRLLGLLRAGDEQLALTPQPSLSRLEHLVADVEQAGLPVELSVEGIRQELPPGVDLSAYRIVQEALTNALKHAGHARARVLVRYSENGLELEVADDGAGVTNGAGGGHGLVGIRERVAVLGGDVEAGPSSSGGFAVRARIPYTTTR